MARVLFGTKPLLKPIFSYCQLGRSKPDSVPFEAKYNAFVRENIFENVVCNIAAFLSPHFINVPSYAETLPRGHDYRLGGKYMSRVFPSTSQPFTYPFYREITWCLKGSILDDPIILSLWNWTIISVSTVAATSRRYQCDWQLWA